MNISTFLQRLFGPPSREPCALPESRKASATREDVPPPDPLYLVHCDGRPSVIGASTFLIAVQLHRLRQQRAADSRKD
jgi:hypothetical protein